MYLKFNFTVALLRQQKGLLCRIGHFGRSRFYILPGCFWRTQALEPSAFYNVESMDQGAFSSSVLTMDV